MRDLLQVCAAHAGRIAHVQRRGDLRACAPCMPAMAMQVCMNGSAETADWQCMHGMAPQDARASRASLGPVGPPHP